MISGGSFWQGFGTGLAVGVFNHAIENGIVENIRKKIAANAFAEIGSIEWSYDVAKDNFGQNTNKCNKFVHDMISEAGVILPTPNGGWIGPKEYPINAGQWADPSFKIKGWKVVSTAKSGDVISLKMSGNGYTGHVGIISRSRAYVKTISADHNTIVSNDWGFRTNQAKAITIRRYVGH